MLAVTLQNVTRYRVITQGRFAKMASAFFLLLLSLHSFAGLPVRNQNPLTGLVGIPQLASATQLGNGQQTLALNTTINSHYIYHDSGYDRLLFDGETYSADFIWRRGFADIEAEIFIPYISYQPGFMDNFIIDWHNFFHLPGGSREMVKNNQLTFFYKGKNRALMNTPSEGIGDIRLTAGKAMARERDYQLSVHLLVKLPTADSEYWLGSGSTDVSLFITQAWQEGSWLKELQLGAIVMGKPDILPDQRRQVAGFASAAVSYSIMQKWSVTAQLDMQTPLYKRAHQTALDDSEMLGVGTFWQEKNWRWHLAVLEDIRVNSAPDVGFQLGVQYSDITNPFFVDPRPR